MFDKVVTYEAIKERVQGEELTAKNIIDAVSGAIQEACGPDREVVFVGGKEHFIDLAGLVKLILEGLDSPEYVERYAAELEEILSKFRYAYEDALIEVFEKNGRVKKSLIETLKQKRSMREESAEYKEFAASYHRRMAKVLTQL
jgi:hypothetical protein